MRVMTYKGVYFTHLLLFKRRTLEETLWKYCNGRCPRDVFIRIPFTDSIHFFLCIAVVF